MKKLLATEALAGLALLLIVGAAAWASRAVAAGDDVQIVTSTFEVGGMTCGGCEVGVEMKVKRLDGVESVAASHEEAEAEVAYDPSRVSPDEIIAAIEDLGYTAELIEDDAER